MDSPRPHPLQVMTRQLLPPPPLPLLLHRPQLLPLVHPLRPPRSSTFTSCSRLLALLSLLLRHLLPLSRLVPCLPEFLPFPPLKVLVSEPLSLTATTLKVDLFRCLPWPQSLAHPVSTLLTLLSNKCRSNSELRPLLLPLTHDHPRWLTSSPALTPSKVNSDLSVNLDRTEPRLCRARLDLDLLLGLSTRACRVCPLTVLVCIQDRVRVLMLVCPSTLKATTQDTLSRTTMDNSSSVCSRNSSGKVSHRTACLLETVLLPSVLPLPTRLRSTCLLSR